jgi:hypothetical protein
VEGLKEFTSIFNEVDNSLLTDTPTVNTYSLAKIYEMGRSVEPYLIACLLQYGGDAVRARSLTVRAGNMYRRISLVRVSVVLVQRKAVGKSLLIGTAAHMLEYGIAMK